MILVLGSASACRQRLMTEAGYEYEVVEASIDERSINASTPSLLASLRAYAKMEHLLSQLNLRDEVIVTADQVVECNGFIYDKPVDRQGNFVPQTVKAQLVSYANHPAEFYTAVCVHNRGEGLTWCDYDRTKVYFNKFTQDQIEFMASDPVTYVAAGSVPTGIVGSQASALVKSRIERIEGDESNFEGLPLGLLSVLLRKVGYFRG